MQQAVKIEGVAEEIYYIRGTGQLCFLCSAETTRTRKAIYEKRIYNQCTYE